MIDQASDATRLHVLKSQPAQHLKRRWHWGDGISSNRWAWQSQGRFWRPGYSDVFKRADEAFFAYPLEVVGRYVEGPGVEAVVLTRRNIKCATDPKTKRSGGRSQIEITVFEREVGDRHRLAAARASKCDRGCGLLYPDQ